MSEKRTALQEIQHYIAKGIGFLIGTTILMLVVWGCLFAWRGFIQWI